MLAAELIDFYPEDYIHYSAENFDFSEITRITSQTKRQILQRSTLSGLKQRQRLRSQQLASSGGFEQKEAEALFSGEMFRNLASLSYEGGPSTLSEMTVPQAIGVLANIDSKMTSIGNFCAQARTTIEQFLSDRNLKDMFDSYAVNILDSYSSRLGTTDMGAIGRKIISDLLDRSNENFFKAVGKRNYLGTAVTKMIAAVAALQDPPDLSGTLYVKHSGSKEITEVSGSQITEELIKKFNKWANYQNSATAETAFALVTLKGNKEILSEFDRLGIKHDSKIGGRYFDVIERFQPSNQIKKLLQQVDGAYKKATGKKRSKADYSFYISDGEIESSIGVNIKNYKNAISPTLQTYDIRVQSGTPLLTMMVREAALSGARMNQIYNLAAVHGDNKGLNAQWNQLIEYLQYKSLLNTLAGFSGPEETYYISINGNLWTMTDFVNHLINSNSTVRWVELQNDNMTGGLSRTPYVRTNVWLAPSAKNPYKAIRRSYRVQQRISNIMYSTKIGVDIQLSELVALFKFVL